LISAAGAVCNTARESGVVHQNFQVGYVGDCVHKAETGTASASASRNEKDVRHGEDSGTQHRHPTKSAHDSPLLVLELELPASKEGVMLRLPFGVAVFS
jgi:hypothetical protein